MGHELVDTLAARRRSHRAYPRRRARFSSDSAKRSIALATAASCFDFKSGARNKVVTTALDFPSMEYFWDAQRQIGAASKSYLPDGVSVPLERILDAIDDGTCLVALAHTSYRSSYRVDARAIVERAHAKGALVLLDVYQSAGVVQLMLLIGTSTS